MHYGSLVRSLSEFSLKWGDLLYNIDRCPPDIKPIDALDFISDKLDRIPSLETPLQVSFRVAASLTTDLTLSTRRMAPTVGAVDGGRQS